MKTVSRITTILATVLAVLALGASVASAWDDRPDPYVGSTTIQTTPLPPTVENAGVANTEVLGTSVTAPTSQERTALALTGSDTAALVTVGGVALVSGLALLALRRRHLSPA
jgi:LPXTG-motif cell wall-anchored protein